MVDSQLWMVPQRPKAEPRCGMIIEMSVGMAKAGEWTHHENTTSH